MAVVMSMRWPQISIDQYDEARSKVDWEGNVPDGAIFHVAWMADDGFRALDVWETTEEFDRFVSERLMPVVAGEMGVTSQPEVTIKPAHAVFKP